MLARPRSLALLLGSLAVSPMLSLPACAGGAPPRAGARAPGDDCGALLAPDPSAEELTVVLDALPGPTVLASDRFGWAPLSGGRSYAVLGPAGYVGTLQTTTRQRLPCDPGEGCRGLGWSARWVDPPSGQPLSATWSAVAFGPVNARYASARVSREPLAAGQGPSEWMRSATIELGEPSPSLEVWRRRCDGDTATVVEVRRHDGSRSVVVRRTIDKDRRPQLD